MYNILEWNKYKRIEMEIMCNFKIISYINVISTEQQ